jgi:hypothetical protein
MWSVSSVQRESIEAHHDIDIVVFVLRKAQVQDEQSKSTKSS